MSEKPRPIRTHELDPDAELIYTVDWTDWLAEISDSATLASSSWIVDDGITVVAEGLSADSKKASIRLAAPTDGEKYYITSRVSGPDGQRDDRTFLIVGKEQ